MGNVALIGFMGTGKSSVGIRLAERLKWKFIDTDCRIQERVGMCIPEIFQRYSEEGFRREESKVIQEVAQLNYCVIATGGGVVLREENIQKLRKSSILICLQAEPEVILQRIKGDDSRPLLNQQNPLKIIKKLLDIRGENYRCADFYVDTSHRDLDSIIEEILIYLKSRGINNEGFKKG